MKNCLKIGLAVLLNTALMLSAHSKGGQSYQIALIVDGPQVETRDYSEIFLKELIGLTDGEFDLQFRQFSADWSALGIQKAINSASWDADIDMILVLGIASTQVIMNEPEFRKPTFLPLLLNAGYVAPGAADGGSGIPNLNYLSDSVPFEDDIDTFQRIVPFQSLTIVADQLTVSTIESVLGGPRAFLTEPFEKDLSVLSYEGPGQPLEELIPEVGVVLLGSLQRMPRETYQEYINLLTERGVPTFSLLSSEEVEMGALAADTLSVDIIRVARQTALNIQAVLLGGEVSRQPTVLPGKRELMINMETARKLGIFPNFDVLSEATLLNEYAAPEGPPLDFLRVANMALARNLDIEVTRLDVEIGARDLRRTRAALLPQLNVMASTSDSNDDELLRSVGSPERTTDAALVLDQLIYSESALSSHHQQGYMQEALLASLTVAQMDQVSNALTAYLQTLQAENRLNIQRENLILSKANLELATDRARIGSDSLAGVYRWQSSVATADSDVQVAHASLKQSHESLNRLLNQSLQSRSLLLAATPDDPFTMSEGEFNDLVFNGRKYQLFGNFMVELGLQKAPELAQLDAQIAASKRQVKEKARAYWVPDVSLRLKYTENIDRSGLGSGEPLEGFDDWSVALNASLPLFSGGARRAELSRAKLSVRQLQVRRDALRDVIEQQIWAELHATQSSYGNIELFEVSASAAGQNLKLVTDSYRQGTVAIVELIDAQNQLVQAQLNSNNAVHDFLLTVVRLQRASGQFDFLLPESEQVMFNEKLRTYIGAREALRTENVR